MILTGKASKDFIKWLHFKHNLQPYNLFNEIIQYALIIEWFDSIEYNEIWSLWDFSFKKIFYSNNNLSILQIQEQAIKKANEIYNS